MHTSSARPNTVDPLAGSFYIESMTDRIEQGAREYIDRIDKIGGAVAAVEEGFIQREIQESAYAYQRAVEKGDRIVVGVNKFQIEEPPFTDILRVDPAVQQDQTTSLAKLRSERDQRRRDPPPWPS